MVRGLAHLAARGFADFLSLQDIRLIDIVNHTHGALLVRRARLRWTPHEAVLQDLLAVSEKRV